MDPLTLMALVGGGLALWGLSKRGSAQTTTPTPLTAATGGPDPATVGVGGLGGITFAAWGPNSDPTHWYQGIKPGTAAVGGQEHSAFDPNNNLKLTTTAAGFAGAGISAAEGLSQAVSHSALFAGSAIGTAIPIIGIGLGIVTSIVGMINAHHQAALAAEGKVLNDTDPRALDAMVLIFQGFLVMQITAGDAQAKLKQVVSDWYAQVKPIQRGKWAFDPKDITADYQTVWKQRKKGTGTNYHAPDPCNGACVIGHFFIERSQYLVMNAITDASKGNHGLLVFDQIPAHETQAGVPQITVVY